MLTLNRNQFLEPLLQSSACRSDDATADVFPVYHRDGDNLGSCSHHQDFVKMDEFAFAAGPDFGLETGSAGEFKHQSSRDAWKNSIRQWRRDQRSLEDEQNTGMAPFVQQTIA